MLTLADDLSGSDVSGEPVEIGEGIYWVGKYIEGDPFQCHAYLLDRGEESVLFDPGSALTFRETLDKVEQIVPFRNIRWFVCHHQDPDITGALPLIDQMVGRGEARVVTHWRARVLLRHLGLKNLDFWSVDENGWRLDLGGRELEFVFTPYAHFPGAFCTFDPTSGVLFSSDLFGGFTEGFQLVARGKEYFESMRPFHEHYIPSREVMQFALSKIEEKAPEFIAPQHGSLIPKDLIPYIFARLRDLECGLYLLADRDTDIARLSKLNRSLQQLTRRVLASTDFRELVGELLSVARQYLPVEALEFYAELAKGRHVHLAPESRYRGVEVPLPDSVAAVLGGQSPSGRVLAVNSEGHVQLDGCVIAVPLHPYGSSVSHSIALFRLSREIDLDDSLREALDRIGEVLAVAVEREALNRSIELERERVYRESIRDPLTGLYTRRYLAEAFVRWSRERVRYPDRHLALLLFDLDHFKSVNDTYGHVAGDEILRRVADALIQGTRTEDVAVRYGGEELAVFGFNASPEGALILAERLRRRIEELRFDGDLSDLRVTASAGVTIHRAAEPLDAFVARADEALYEAKRTGRNRVVVRCVSDEC